MEIPYSWAFKLELEPDWIQWVCGQSFASSQQHERVDLGGLAGNTDTYKPGENGWRRWRGRIWISIAKLIYIPLAGMWEKKGRIWGKDLVQMLVLLFIKVENMWAGVGFWDDAIFCLEPDEFAMSEEPVGEVYVGAWNSGWGVETRNSGLKVISIGEGEGCGWG